MPKEKHSHAIRHSYTIKTLLALTALTGLASCRHKDLYMEEDMTSRLEVKFDWRDAPEANPNSMALYMYESDGNSPLRFIFSNKTGGEIKVPFGTRHAICLNADINSWGIVRNRENIEMYEVYTPDADALSAQSLRSEGIPRAEGTENERLAATPGMLWGTRTNDIKVVPHEGTQTITMYPHECVCHYMVDVYDVDNLEGVEKTAIDGTLSGMAEAYNHGMQSGNETPATMAFTMTGDPASKSLHGEFLTFGECPTNKVNHYLMVYTVLNDGSRWYRKFDVTDQVSQAPDPTHVHIIVRGLDLPKTVDPGHTTLTPDVNEWQSVNIGLSM